MLPFTPSCVWERSHTLPFLQGPGQATNLGKARPWFGGHDLPCGSEPPPRLSVDRRRCCRTGRRVGPVGPGRAGGEFSTEEACLGSGVAKGGVSSSLQDRYNPGTWVRHGDWGWQLGSPKEDQAQMQEQGPTVRCGLQRREHGYPSWGRSILAPCCVGSGESGKDVRLLSMSPLPCAFRKQQTYHGQKQPPPPSLSADPPQVPGPFGNVCVGLLGLSSGSTTK